MPKLQTQKIKDKKINIVVISKSSGAGFRETGILEKGRRANLSRFFPGQAIFSSLLGKGEERGSGENHETIS
jgi:hypothetical protein